MLGLQEADHPQGDDMTDLELLMEMEREYTRILTEDCNAIVKMWEQQNKSNNQTQENDHDDDSQNQA